MFILYIISIRRDNRLLRNRFMIISVLNNLARLFKKLKNFKDLYFLSLKVESYKNVQHVIKTLKNSSFLSIYNLFSREL